MRRFTSRQFDVILAPLRKCRTYCEMWLAFPNFVFHQWVNHAGICWTYNTTRPPNIHTEFVSKTVSAAYAMKLIAAIPFWSLLSAAGPAVSQFISAPTNLRIAFSHSVNHQIRYKEVPAGICEQRDDIRSISGYVDISADEHIFFWFFEARNADPTTAPLTTWINGGPGTSSMVGLFQEVGPCLIKSNGMVVDNPYSWTNASNLLFIDQPVQTGFSYSRTTPGYISPENGSVIVAQDGTCPSEAISNGTCGTYSNPDGLLGLPVSTSAAASSFYASLQGFMRAFPQYARGGFHFATGQYQWYQLLQHTDVFEQRELWRALWSCIRQLYRGPECQRGIRDDEYQSRNGDYCEWVDESSDPGMMHWYNPKLSLTLIPGNLVSCVLQFHSVTSFSMEFAPTTAKLIRYSLEIHMITRLITYPMKQRCTSLCMALAVVSNCSTNASRLRPTRSAPPRTISVWPTLRTSSITLLAGTRVILDNFYPIRK